MTDLCDHTSDTCTEKDDYKEFDSDEDEFYIGQMEYSESERHKDFIISDSDSDSSDSDYTSTIYSSVYSSVYNDE